MQKRILNNVKRYLAAIDAEHVANDNCDDKAEERAVNKQFLEMDKLIENYSKTTIKKTCMNNDNKRITQFYKMYMV